MARAPSLVLAESNGSFGDHKSEAVDKSAAAGSLGINKLGDVDEIGG